MAKDGDKPTFGVQELFNSYSGRRSGIIKALTTDLDQVYELYRSNNEIQGQDHNDKQPLCLYGSTNQQWEVILREKKERPVLPLGINLATKERTKEGWLSSIAVRSDLWLIAVAFFFTRGFDKADREQLFDMINSLPTVHEVVSATVESMPAISDMQGPNVEENLIKEGDVLDEQVNNLCGICGQKEAPGNCELYENEWVACDSCGRWYHCKCENITLAEAKALERYKCLSCRSK